MHTEAKVSRSRSEAGDVPNDPDGPGPRLRLCFASPRYHPFYSGAAVRFQRYFAGFRERGVDVEVCTATPDPAKAAAAGMSTGWEDLPAGTFLPPEEVEGIPVHRVRLPDHGGFRRAAGFAQAVVDHCRRDPRPPDVIQLFTPALTATPALWKLRRMGIPIVATRTMMPSLPRNPLKRRLRRASMRIATRFTDCEVVGSGAMLKAFRELGFPGGIEVIPHGVDTARFRPPNGPREIGALRHELGLPEGATVALFVGAVTPRKGVHRLLEAWCHLAPVHPNLHVVVAGPRLDRTSPDHAAYHKRLKELARSSGARERLHFPGVVSRVEDYMRAADIFVFPSSREGMPNVVGEAMASGLPVLTCPFSGLSSEFGEPGKHYLLTDFEPRSISEEIDRLLTTPHRREEVGRDARAWAEAHLDVKRSIASYAELYFKTALKAQARSPRKPCAECS